MLLSDSKLHGIPFLNKQEYKAKFRELYQKLLNLFESYIEIVQLNGKIYPTTSGKETEEKNEPIRSMFKICGKPMS